MRLLTNNPDKRAGSSSGSRSRIASRCRSIRPPRIGYLRAKQQKMGTFSMCRIRAGRGGAGVTTFVGEHEGPDAGRHRGG